MKIEKLAKIFKDKIRKLYEFILNKTKDCGTCDLCINACEKMEIGAIIRDGIGIFSKVSIQQDNPSRECIGCAVCVNICPKNIIKMVDKNGEREIWNKKFKLVKCQECGKYYATEEHLKYAYNRLGMKLDKLRCEKCKRKARVEDIKRYI